MFLISKSLNLQYLCRRHPTLRKDQILRSQIVRNVCTWQSLAPRHDRERMPRLSLPYFARCVPPINQRCFLSSISPRHLSTFPALRSTKQPPQRPAELDRARGVPLNSTEAGPSTPGGIPEPETWSASSIELLSSTIFVC